MSDLRAIAGIMWLELEAAIKSDGVDLRRTDIYSGPAVTAWLMQQAMDHAKAVAGGWINAGILPEPLIKVLVNTQANRYLVAHRLDGNWELDDGSIIYGVKRWRPLS